MKANIPLDKFIAWLETQPPETAYDYTSIATCAVAAFLKAAGAMKYKLASNEIPGDIREAIHPLGDRDWTYGAALKRARAIQSVSSTK